MDAAEQIQQAVAREAPMAEVASRIAGLLTENVLTWAGIAVAGMLIGVAFTGLVRLMFLPKDPDAPALERRMRKRQYAAIACAFGFGWSSLAAGIYTALYVSEMPIVWGIVITAVGPIAGAGTPLMYDLLRWLRSTAAPAVGHAVIEFVRKHGAAALAAVVSTLRRGKDKPEEPK